MTGDYPGKDALAESNGYRALCDDPRYAEVPGKFELDVRGGILMSPPPSNYHGALQIRLAQKLVRLGGRVITEASIVIHGYETPYSKAPELCIEVVSPSNSVKELNEKREAYPAAGAVEAWVVYPKSKRCEFHGAQGPLESSAYAVALSGLFDDQAE